jgi:hypothetical protein
VRGVCAGTKLATSILNDVKNQVKTAFLDYLPDVWIHTDYDKGKGQGEPGCALVLRAETDTGAMVTFDGVLEGRV